MSKTWGVCSAPSCFVNTNERCEWTMCRECCGKFHQVAMAKGAHTGFNNMIGFKSNTTTENKKEDEQPEPVPDFGKVEKTTDPEYPLEISKVW